MIGRTTFFSSGTLLLGGAGWAGRSRSALGLRRDPGPDAEAVLDSRERCASGRGKMRVCTEQKTSPGTIGAGHPRYGHLMPAAGALLAGALGGGTGRAVLDAIMGGGRMENEAKEL